MQKSNTQKIISVSILVALLSSILFPAFSLTAAAQPDDVRIQDFTEMLPGVFVSWRWWNQTSNDWGMSNTESEGLTQWYRASDNLTNSYLIKEEGQYTWQHQWTYTCLYVTILQDPDRSFVRWLQDQTGNHEAHIQNPERSALTGDEVFIHAVLFYHYHQLTYTYNFTYTWYDASSINTPIDPTPVIPSLTAEFAWAMPMTGNKMGSGTRTYCHIGFGITQFFLVRTYAEEPTDLTLVPITWLKWAQHQFAGLTAFNDTDGDGLIDVYRQDENFYHDSQPELEYPLVDGARSELAYHFVAENATVGAVAFPYVNEDNQIQWSMEFRDINGKLMPLPSLFASPQRLLVYIPGIRPVGLPTTLDHLEFVCRFQVVPTRTILKVDQHIGTFLVPHTQEVLPEANGLSLALSYWSGFSIRNLRIFSTTNEINSEELETTENLSGGHLSIRALINPLAAIDFGGTYVWEKDGGTYDVGTVITPIIAFLQQPMYVKVPEVVGFFKPYPWIVARFFYSSCYRFWDGYAITHDPIYTVFPAGSNIPTSPNGTWALLPAVILSVITIVALSVVIFRIRGIQRSSRSTGS